MFDERLKKLREERGLTQKQVAEALNMNPRTYSSYENNEREPNSEILLLIADLFDVSIDYLVGYDERRIIKNEIGRTKDIELNKAEIDLIQSYRNLSYQGKEHLKTTMEMYKSYFANDTVHITKSRDNIIKDDIVATEKEDTKNHKERSLKYISYCRNVNNVPVMYVIFRRNTDIVYKIHFWSKIGENTYLIQIYY